VPFRPGPNAKAFGYAPGPNAKAFGYAPGPNAKAFGYALGPNAKAFGYGRGQMRHWLTRQYIPLLAHLGEAPHSY